MDAECAPDRQLAKNLVWGLRRLSLPLSGKPRPACACPGRTFRACVGQAQCQRRARDPRRRNEHVPGWRIWQACGGGRGGSLGEAGRAPDRWQLRRPWLPGNQCRAKSRRCRLGRVAAGVCEPQWIPAGPPFLTGRAATRAYGCANRRGSRRGCRVGPCAKAGRPELADTRQHEKGKWAREWPCYLSSCAEMREGGGTRRACP